jgi:hypothetical protein
MSERPIGRRLVLSAVAGLVLVGNFSAILRGFEDVPDRSTQRLQFHLYDTFMMYHLIMSYSLWNTEAQISGHVQGGDETAWIPLNSSEFFPFREGYVSLRLFTLRHRHMGGGPEAQRFLAAKIRQRHNRLHPEQTIDAVAFGTWQWPVSPAGYEAERTPELEHYSPWFSEEPPS